MKLRLAAIALILVGVGAVVLAVVGPTFGSTINSKYLTSTVTTGTVNAQSVATGTIAASTVYGFKFGVTPDIVSSVATTSGGGGSTGSASNSQGGSSLIWPVLSVDVTVGQKVTKGTTLASADTTAANLQLTSAQATLASAQAKLTADAGKDASIVLTDQAQVATAQATVNADQAIVTAATLTAPADGLIIAVNLLPGVNAPNGYAIEESVGPMVATAGFAESDIASLKVGQSATVSVTGAKVSVPGTLTQIVPVASSSGGNGSGSSVATYAVTVTLTSPPDTVLAGMTASVTVTTASVDNATRVPATALAGSAAA
jgi:membrane fusion protein, macrolide-specific efflux system